MLQCYYNNLHPVEAKRLILIGSEGTPYLLVHSRKPGNGRFVTFKAIHFNTEGTVLKRMVQEA